mmetsp:Transcript_3885/g.10757  ORF Transcript_3885/g.10757 Transcript_3885/m.10757 type:complete len:206 (-) Transcript_3885:1416-2033(-)
MRDDLEAVALVHKELLSFVRKVHFLGIFGHQRVEKCVELIRCGFRFRPQNASKSLSLLSPRPVMGRNLDNHTRVGNIDGRVADFGNEKRPCLWVELKLPNDVHPLGLFGCSVDHGLVEFEGIVIQSVHTVRKHDDLISPGLVELNEKLTGSNLVWIHNPQQFAARNGISLEVFSIEFRGHRAPDFRTLDAGEIATALEIEPVGLV